MSVEGCSLDSDEGFYAGLEDVTNGRNWNGHTITLNENGLANPIKGYPMQGWGEIKNRILPMSSVGGSVEGKKDKDGNAAVEGEVHVTVKDKDGNKVSVSAEASVKSNNEGKITTDGSVKISYDKEF